MKLNIFVNNGTDDSLVKALNKNGLVQKQVTVHGKNGDYQAMKWVKASEDQPEDKPVKKPDEKSDKASKVEKFINDMAKDADKMSRGDLQASVEAFAMTNGLDDNELLDKIDKQVTYDKNVMANADKYDKIDTNNKDRMSKMSNPDSVIRAKNRLAELRGNGQSNTKDQKSDDSGKPASWTRPTDKASLANLLQSGMSRDDIMNNAKADGVTWKHSDHPGINWMRCSMALTGTSTRGSKEKVSQDNFEPVKESKESKESISNKYTADEFKNIIGDKAIEHLKSGEGNDIALQVNKDGEVLQGIRYDEKNDKFLLGSDGSNGEDELTESEVRKIVSNKLKGKVGKQGVDLSKYFLGDSRVVDSLPEPIYSDAQKKKMIKENAITKCCKEKFDELVGVAAEMYASDPDSNGIYSFTIPGSKTTVHINVAEYNKNPNSKNAYRVSHKSEDGSGRMITGPGHKGETVSEILDSYFSYDAKYDSKTETAELPKEYQNIAVKNSTPETADSNNILNLLWYSEWSSVDPKISKINQDRPYTYSNGEKGHYGDSVSVNLGNNMFLGSKAVDDPSRPGRLVDVPAIFDLSNPDSMTYSVLSEEQAAGLYNSHVEECIRNKKSLIGFTMK